MSNNPNRRARRNRSRLDRRPSADAAATTGADPVARAAYPPLGRWGKPAAAGALAIALSATSLAPASIAGAATPRPPDGLEQLAPGLAAVLMAAQQDLPDGEREFDPWDLDLEADHQWTMRSTEAEVATISVQVGGETVPIAVVDRRNREIQMTGDGVSSLVVEPCAPVPGAPDPLHCVALPADTGGDAVPAEAPAEPVPEEAAPEEPAPGEPGYPAEQREPAASFEVPLPERGEWHSPAVRISGCIAGGCFVLMLQVDEEKTTIVVGPGAGVGAGVVLDTAEIPEGWEESFQLRLGTRLGAQVGGQLALDVYDNWNGTLRFNLDLGSLRFGFSFSYKDGELDFDPEGAARLRGLQAEIAGYLAGRFTVPHGEWDNPTPRFEEALERIGDLLDQLDPESREWVRQGLRRMLSYYPDVADEIDNLLFGDEPSAPGGSDDSGSDGGGQNQGAGDGAPPPPPERRDSEAQNEGQGTSSGEGSEGAPDSSGGQDSDDPDDSDDSGSEDQSDDPDGTDGEPEPSGPYPGTGPPAPISGLDGGESDSGTPDPVLASAGASGGSSEWADPDLWSGQVPGGDDPNTPDGEGTDLGSLAGEEPGTSPEEPEASTTGGLGSGSTGADTPPNPSPNPNRDGGFDPDGAIASADSFGGTDASATGDQSNTGSSDSASSFGGGGFDGFGGSDSGGGSGSSSTGSDSTSSDSSGSSSTGSDSSGSSSTGSDSSGSDSSGSGGGSGSDGSSGTDAAAGAGAAGAGAAGAGAAGAASGGAGAGAGGIGGDSSGGVGV